MTLWYPQTTQLSIPVDQCVFWSKCLCPPDSHAEFLAPKVMDEVTGQGSMTGITAYETPEASTNQEAGPRRQNTSDSWTWALGVLRHGTQTDGDTETT